MSDDSFAVDGAEDLIEKLHAYAAEPDEGADASPRPEVQARLGLDATDAWEQYDPSLDETRRDVFFSGFALGQASVAGTDHRPVAPEVQAGYYAVCNGLCDLDVNAPNRDCPMHGEHAVAVTTTSAPEVQTVEDALRAVRSFVRSDDMASMGVIDDLDGFAVALNALARTRPAWMQKAAAEHAARRTTREDK